MVKMSVKNKIKALLLALVIQICIAGLGLLDPLLGLSVGNVPEVFLDNI